MKTAIDKRASNNYVCRFMYIYYIYKMAINNRASVRSGVLKEACMHVLNKCDIYLCVYLTAHCTRGLKNNRARSVVHWGS